jgi:hypothetical protein
MIPTCASVARSSVPLDVLRITERKAEYDKRFVREKADRLPPSEQLEADLRSRLGQVPDEHAPTLTEMLDRGYTFELSPFNCAYYDQWGKHFPVFELRRPDGAMVTQTDGKLVQFGAKPEYPWDDRGGWSYGGVGNLLSMAQFMGPYLERERMAESAPAAGQLNEAALRQKYPDLAPPLQQWLSQAASQFKSWARMTSGVQTADLPTVVQHAVRLRNEWPQLKQAAEAAVGLPDVRTGDISNVGRYLDIMKSPQGQQMSQLTADVEALLRSHHGVGEQVTRRLTQLTHEARTYPQIAAHVRDLRPLAAGADAHSSDKVVCDDIGGELWSERNAMFDRLDGALQAHVPAEASSEQRSALRDELKDLAEQSRQLGFCYMWSNAFDAGGYHVTNPQYWR